jgi:mannosylglycerate hydrolase
MTSPVPATVATRRVDIVAHTHWDREWYRPFQSFRARLVELIDSLLDRLQADQAYAHFLLDGQMAVVEDYLAIRPERKAALQTLAAEGRLAMGPWYTLPDEFLVSGETHIRNLQRGLLVAADFGGAMEVGYLPDMFGHVAQMPQLLRLFGFEHAVVWRGVPAAVTATGFWWRSPDGSTVRAEYLPTGYGNGATMPRDPAVLLSEISEWVNDQRALVGDRTVLWMNGSDHLTPQPFLPQVVAEANVLAAGSYELVVTSLAGHLAAAGTADLTTWTGELRSGARANLLMGVASNRVDIHQLSATAERALEQRAEPLAALLQPAEQWPAALLDAAWLEMVRNAAHDSVCACSHDDVTLAVEHRYAEARAIAEAVEERALRYLADNVSVKGPVAVNAAQRSRGGLVEVQFPGTDAWPGAQVTAIDAGVHRHFDLPMAQGAAVIADEVMWAANCSGITLTERHDSLHVVIVCDGGPVDVPRNRGLVRQAVLASPSSRMTADIRVPPTHRALVHVDSVAGYGWRAIAQSHEQILPKVAAVTVTAATIDNSLVTVDVDERDGTFAINGIAGYGRFVDDGDAGDTYNWSPPDHQHVIDQPEAVSVSVSEDGPLRARVQIRSIYQWPQRIDEVSERRMGMRLVTVVTTIEVRAGESMVRISVEFDNAVQDHRLRVHLPLPAPARSSRAECAFTVVERGLTAEGGPTEVAMATFPSRRFVQAGGLTVAHHGILEYELVDVTPAGATTLALTILRATRFLSRGSMTMRPLPAGPHDELLGSQMPGPHRVEFAVSVDAVDPYALVDNAFLPLAVVYGSGDGQLPEHHQCLDIRGDVVVSALRRTTDGLEVRCFNPGEAPATVTIDGRRGSIVDLRGNVLGVFAGTTDVGSHQIITLHLTG